MPKPLRRALLVWSPNGAKPEWRSTQRSTSVEIDETMNLPYGCAMVVRSTRAAWSQRTSSWLCMSHAAARCQGARPPRRSIKTNDTAIYPISSTLFTGSYGANLRANHVELSKSSAPSGVWDWHTTIDTQQPDSVGVPYRVRIAYGAAFWLLGFRLESRYIPSTHYTASLHWGA